MEGNNLQIPISGNSVAVPVTTDAVYSIGPILISFLIIGILIGISFYLFSKNYRRQYKQENVFMPIIIHNETKIPYKIVTSEETKKIYTLMPSESSNFLLTQNDLINAYSYSYDGTPIHHQFRLLNPRIKKLYITQSGFRSNLSGSENVMFVNNSFFSVVFIEKSSKGGKRWISSILPPKESSGNHFVGKRTTWEVASSSYEDDPISQITIDGNVKKIVFDGDKLKSY